MHPWPNKDGGKIGKSFANITPGLYPIAIALLRKHKSFIFQTNALVKFYTCLNFTKDRT